MKSSNEAVHSFIKLEKLIKSIANRRRIAIVAFLKRREDATVGTLAEHLHLSFKATSKHVNVLYVSELLEREQKSSEMHYRLAPAPHTLIKHLRDLL